MLNDTEKVEVYNFTNQRVVYTIPEKNIRRDFSGFETKLLEVGELRELYFKTGGAKLLQDYLAVRNKELALEFGVTSDQFSHEYSWTEKDIDNMLLHGTEDELADALDYAPMGIVETIVNKAVELRIPDMNKRKLIKEMTGKDVSKKISYAEILDADVENMNTTPTRRRAEKAAPIRTGRRAG